MYRVNYDGIGIIRLSDNAIIPENAENADWVQYQGWLAEGNTPDSADPLPWEMAPTKDEQLRATDKKMARVAEDVISVLVAKGLIEINELPADAVAAIEERKQLRLL